ncbi:MAG: sigma-54-dependent Fis family transcriptional regulator [Deltaproteobacteria bacterium]|nr:sigma-54-dependent Fis family transcriptional regulator [Deltaproteobacteria bacterium]
MKRAPNIVIIEQDPAASADLAGRLRGLGIKEYHTLASTISIREVSTHNPDLAIIGESMDPETWLKCVHLLKILGPSLPIITFTKYKNDFAELGECDPSPFEGICFIEPDLGLKELQKKLYQALREKEQDNNHEVPILIGRSKEILEIRRKISAVSDKDITVLITGETGTGKELIARSVHFNSTRKKGPIVKINCTALPSDLLESEVFGFQKGAFTGAHRNKPGRIELAHKGTLFIDEIGALSVSLQAKFLQILEDKAFSRLGGTHDRALDIRVIAATNADLSRMLREGTFRKDLYYRLNMFHIGVSPLRERRVDIPLLIHYFLNKYSFELNKDVIEMPPEVKAFLTDYHWPGNVRELENIIRRAIVLKSWNFVFSELQGNGHDRSREVHLPQDSIARPWRWPEERLKQFLTDKSLSLKKITKAYVSEAEKEMILKALRSTEWNRKKAAQRLKVSYKTLLNRIEEYDLKP